MIAHEKALAEEQLFDGREWLFDTVSPSFADISLHFLYACISPFPAAKTLFDASKFPKFVAVRLSLVLLLRHFRGLIIQAQWLARMAQFLKSNERSGHFTKVTGEQAAQEITASQFDTLEFDDQNAQRLGLAKGVRVSIAPDDTGQLHHCLPMFIPHAFLLSSSRRADIRHPPWPQRRGVRH